MQNIIENIKESLSGIYSEHEITSLTKLIVEHVTGQALPLFLSDKSKKITSEEEQKIKKIVERLQTSEPIQYILGETEFFGMPFVVNENVLIPRQETEELVELILSENKNRAEMKILDIGTGSGAIAITLAKHMKNADISAWDISYKALDTAVFNSKINSVNIFFKRIDVLESYPVDEKFDVIVSNPPYVLESEKKTMERNVLDYEPHSALFVPDDNPLLFYIKIADISQQLLKPDGKLYLEINQKKGQETKAMLIEKGFQNVAIIQDISGNDRIIRTDYKQI